MVDWIKCSFRNPREDECQLYDYDLEEPYGPFLVTIELSNGSRYSKQAYYRPKSNIWFRSQDDPSTVKPVVAWSHMVAPLAGSKDNALSKYKGKDNPINELLYLSLEIGKQFLDLTYGITEKEYAKPDGATPLIQRYFRVLQSVNALSSEEIGFLYKDSVVCKSKEMGKKLRLIESGIPTQHLLCSQLASKDFLIRTMGIDEGTKEYLRRLSLHKLSSLVMDDSLIEDAIGYVLGEGKEVREDVRVLFKKASCKLSLGDLEYIRDIRKLKFKIDE